ncbi:MAG: 1-acyl-sn-glycerol-3-phosphate acyltransferase [Clostridia bacterium]|nr:lysophospholipid acyltransferase family protein [Lachnospiraceae bacterium]NCC01604.1 1-acyl-sn-glycerol-3-phosphate acyltransferase [Clostridia bacterium]NCD02361.1 1-acyl-sn-glycerol-3-phosphate acyltransferase [Clostridia bacterium]
MERIILMVIRLFYKVPEWWYKICHYGKDENFEKYDEEKRYALLQELTHRANKAGRVNVICSGKENLPKENGYILFPNHQGLFDTLLFFDTHGRFFSFVMKIEVAHVFLIRQIARLIHAKAMDRSDVRQSMTVIKQVSEEVKQGRNYLIFAEGTRSRQGNKLLPFKGGAFKSAVYAKCPIVPVAIIDSYKAFDIHSIKKITAQIHYLEPIYYETYKDMKTTEIAELVKSRIEAAIEQYEIH